MIGLRTSVGSRPHKVTFQDPTAAVPDGDGGFTNSWFDLDPPSLYVEIKPATARDLERLASGTVLATASHVISGPYHPQVSTHSRIVFRGRVFQVTGVSDPEERHVETICVCVELLGTALIEDYAWTAPGWIETDPAWVQEGTL